MGFLGDWAGLLLIFTVLGLIACWFSRRTFRIAVLVVLVAGAAVVTRYGLSRPGQRTGSFDSAFDLGGGRIERAMLGPLLPGGHRVLPGLGGWIVLLVLLGAVLVYLDTVCARREQPRVRTASPAPPASPGAVTERLQFRLPAVEVRKPAVMPGGSTLGNLAAVVSESGVQGSSALAALMRAIRALEAQPRTYEARLLIEPCDAAGQVSPGGDLLRMTVDLRDARNEQSIAVRMLPPCVPAEAAERVAGFTARQVFRHDVATPSWAVGSADGEDLSAYLLARLQNPRSRSFADRYESRQLRRELLESAVASSPNAGAVQYDLAGLCDLDGHHLESLLLHLDNRVHHPRFLRGRYRLALSLAMLSTPALFDPYWSGRDEKPTAAPYRDRAAMKSEVIRILAISGMLRILSDSELQALTSSPHPGCPGSSHHCQQATLARLALLRLARRELQAYRAALRPGSLLWSAFWHRPERASKLALLRAPPCWWRHPKRRRWAAWFSLDIIEQRIHDLGGDHAAGGGLAAAQHQARRLLGFSAEPGAGGPWIYGKAPWQAVYNAACLHAQAAAGDGAPDPKAAGQAVALLRLAIGDPACELDRPSEWIAMDPDLRSLRQDRGFADYVREQARRDFAAAEPAQVGDPWFREQLPTAPPAPPAGSSPPAGSLDSVPRARRGDRLPDPDIRRVPGRSGP